MSRQPAVPTQVRPLRVGVVDVGGSSMRRGTVSIGPAASPVVSDVVSDPTATNPDEAVDQVLALAEAASHDAAAVGVVLPGLVDESDGVGVWSENIGWRDVAFGDLLRSRLTVPVAIGHDVRAWGAAEHRWGAGHGLSDVAVVVVGTGISAALFVDGRPLVARGFAGEFGHLRVAEDQPCACGGTGCLEAVASAAGIVRSYNAVADRSVAGAVDVADAVRRGEAVAVDVWSTALDRLADGLAALTTVVAPEAIVLGGGLALAGEEILFAPLRRRLADRLHYPPVPDLLHAAFEGTGGLVGAALLAVELLEDPR
jgi:glucokinase